MKSTLYKNTARFWFAVLLLLAGFSRADAAPPDELTAFIEEGMDLWHVPGLAAAVVSSNEVSFRRGFGTTEMEGGEAVDEHTLFAIASTTKAMVVTGILMLVDEGRISLDDPIIRHVPELHFNDSALTDQIMVRDLLTHRTGLPSTDIWSFFLSLPLQEQIRRMPAVAAAAPLRTRFIYQNTMYDIAGLVIERISGQRWDHFLRERLWSPLGMNETFGSRGMGDAGLSRVMPHVYIDEELRIARWDFLPDQASAAGSVWSSVHDMSLWVQFLLRDCVTEDGVRLVSEELASEMFQPQTLILENDFYPASELSDPHWRSYGLGWFQQDFQGRKIDFHTGSLTGLVAIVGLDRATDRGVVVLGNRDHAEMRHAVLWRVMDDDSPPNRRDWNRAIFDLYQDNDNAAAERWAELKKQRLVNTRTSRPLKNFAGRYSSPFIGEVLIERVDRNLVLKMPNYEFTLAHWHLDTFLLQHDPWNMKEFAEFRVGPDGSLTALELFGESFVPLDAD